MKSLKPMLIFAVALVVSACDRDRDTSEVPQPMKPHESTTPNPNETPEREPAPSQAAADMTQRAVEAITSARCEREARCKNIGPDQDYATMAACEAGIRSEWKDDLNAMECGGGVVQKELDECLEQVRNENCANPFQTLGRMGACHSKTLCKEIAAR